MGGDPRDCSLVCQGDGGDEDDTNLMARVVEGSRVEGTTGSSGILCSPGRFRAEPEN